MMAKMRRRWRVSICTALIAVSLASSGHASTREDTPVTSVSIGSRDLAVSCAGQGSPLVLFEAGYGGGIDNWTLVLPGVSEITRACSYDRAGIGQSDPPADTPRAAPEIATDIEALLNVVGADEPIVLVGFSIGGLFARYYAGVNPEHIAGVVLIDPTPPEWPSMSLAGTAAPQMASRLKVLAGFDDREPESIDTLKVGVQAMIAPPIQAPVFMLDAGIVSLNPGMPGDELTRVLRHLQKRQQADLNAELEIAELCMHAIPLDCPEEAVQAVVNMVERVRTTEAANHTNDGRSRRSMSIEPARVRTGSLESFEGTTLLEWFVRDDEQERSPGQP